MMSLWSVCSKFLSFPSVVENYGRGEIGFIICTSRVWTWVVLWPSGGVWRLMAMTQGVLGAFMVLKLPCATMHRWGKSKVTFVLTYYIIIVCSENWYRRGNSYPSSDISCQHVGQDRGVNALTIEWTARVGISLWLIDIIVQLGLGLTLELGYTPPPPSFNFDVAKSVYRNISSSSYFHILFALNTERTQSDQNLLCSWWSWTRTGSANQHKCEHQQITQSRNK